MALAFRAGRVGDDAAALGDAAINYEVHASIVEDAVRFVPELAPLAAAPLQKARLDKLQAIENAQPPLTDGAAFPAAEQSLAELRR